MRNFLTIVLLIISILVSAQENSIDSLKKAAKNLTGEDLIKTYCELSKTYSSINADSGIYYSEKTIILIENEKKEEYYAQIYNILALGYFYKGNKEELIKYNKKSFEYAEKFEEYTYIGKYYNMYGVIYQQKAQYDSALISFEKAIENYNKVDDNYKLLANSYDNIGIIHFYKGEYKSALENLIKSKEYNEKTNDISSIAGSYYKIGTVYAETYELDNAEKYTLKAYEILKETDKYIENIRVLNLLGIISKKQQNYQISIEYYLKALDVLKIYPVPYIEAAVYANIGNLYFMFDKSDDAEIYLKKSLELSKSLNNKSQTAACLFSLAEIDFSKEKYILAKEKLLQSLEIYHEIVEQENILKCYNLLIDIFDKENDYKSLSKYYNLYIDLKDTLYETQKNFALDSLQTMFSTKEIESENIILAKETEIKSKTIENQRIYLISAIIIILLIFLLIIIILKNRNKLKIAYQTVNQKNTEISQYAEELKTTNDKLVELDKFKEGLMQMIVHDLKNPLNNLMNIDVFENQQDQIRIVKQTTKQIINQTYDILDVYKYENNSMNLKIEDIQALQLVNNSIDEVKNLLEQKNIKQEILIPSEVNLNCDITIIKRVITNLLTNAIKFSENNSKIIVELKAIEKEAQISITNYGNPISKEFRNKIFEKFSQYEAKNSGLIRSTGLGLAFCKLAIENHHKNIYIDENFTEGARFIFSLPLSENKSETFLENSTSDDEFSFTENEISFLNTYIEQLKSIPIYNITKVKTLTEEIKSKLETEKIANWANEIYKSAVRNNNERFLELLQVKN